MQLAALPLLAVRLTSDPRLVAGLTAAASLPWLFFSLFAGIIVDRYDRRRLMIAMNLARTALIGALAGTVATGASPLYFVYLIVLVEGIGETVFNSAGQALLPTLVERDRLETANGGREVAEAVLGPVLGAPLGSYTFVAAAALPFAGNALSFGVGALLIWQITARPPAAEVSPSDTKAPRKAMMASIKEGMVWLWGNKVLRTLCFALGVGNFAAFAAEATLVLFALQRLGLSAGQFGVLLMSRAIGAVVGGLLSPRLARRLGPRPSITISLGSLALGYGSIAFSSSAVLVGLILAMMGGATTMWNVVTISLRQTLIPEELFGRVNSAYRFIGFGVRPVGAVIGGLAVTWFGLASPFAAASALTACALLIVLIATDRQDIERAKGHVPSSDPPPMPA